MQRNELACLEPRFCWCCRACNNVQLLCVLRIGGVDSHGEQRSHLILPHRAIKGEAMKQEDGRP